VSLATGAGDRRRRPAVESVAGNCRKSRSRRLHSNRSRRTNFDPLRGQVAALPTISR